MSRLAAIVGRPNVGKSTLFNRLTESRSSITHDTSGVTRDRKYGEAEWQGSSFRIIDTGGLVPHSGDIFEKAIKKQVQIAIEEADLILFMVDVTTGVTDLDDEVTKILRRSRKEVIVVVNKVDNNQRLQETSEFYSLGFEHYNLISSVTGSGTGELLENILKLLPEESEPLPGDLPRFAVVGKPNVGKSSFINVLTGQERNIVTNIAGTTRDAIHTHYNLFNKEFILVDTAGLRKKAKVHQDLEYYSVVRAINAVEAADVCLLMLDAEEGMAKQDLSIFRLIQSRKKGLVILVNKWDIFEKDQHTAKEYDDAIRAVTAPWRDIPIIYISALEKKRIYQAMEEALLVAERLKKKIPASQLNKKILPKINQTPPPAIKGRFIQIKYVSQLPTNSVSFAFFCNFPKLIKEPYRNFLEKCLRQEFDLTGVPVNIFFREK